jgi:hypothetical protein
MLGKSAAGDIPASGRCASQTMFTGTRTEDGVTADDDDDDDEEEEEEEEEEEDALETTDAVGNPGIARATLLCPANSHVMQVTMTHTQIRNTSTDIQLTNIRKKQFHKYRLFTMWSCIMYNINTVNKEFTRRTTGKNLARP